MRLPLFLAFVFSVTATCMLNQVPVLALDYTPCDTNQQDRDNDDRDRNPAPAPRAQDPVNPILDPHGKDPHSEVHDNDIPARNPRQYF